MTTWIATLLCRIGLHPWGARTWHESKIALRDIPPRHVGWCEQRCRICHQLRPAHARWGSW